MSRIVAVVALVIGLCLAPAPAAAHVGSPDVFFEGDAGPYRLDVTIRTPLVIPGIATIEIRSETADVTGLSVVAMRLTGAGSEHPPVADRAERSTIDPKFYTASLWLMERGSLQVRITVDGTRGPGTLAVPIAASAKGTLGMNRGLGVMLFALMLLVALSIISIAAAAVREAALDPGVEAGLTARRRTRVATLAASVVVATVLALGARWWSSEAADYANLVERPWIVVTERDRCRLTLPEELSRLLPDHGHEMHLFLVRVPQLDQLAHLHPRHVDNGGFVQDLPSLPAGHYQLFADVVFDSGYPITGIAELELPALSCAPVEGDDSQWSGDRLDPASARPTFKLPDGATVVWDRPPVLHATAAISLRFHVVAADGTPARDLEPYMGMAGHAEIVRDDVTVFAHLHPSGSIPMPSLALAQHTTNAPATPAMPNMPDMPDMPDMPGMPGMTPPGVSLPPVLAFPYGFPQAGSYRIFVQLKRNGHVDTAAFDARVEP